MVSRKKTNTHTLLKVIFQVNFGLLQVSIILSLITGRAETLNSLFLKQAGGVAHKVLWTIPHPVTLTTIPRGLEAQDVR